MVGDNNEKDRLIKKNLNELREVEKELQVARNMIIEIAVDRNEGKIK